MPDARMTRRLAGLLVTRLHEARFDEVQDGRDPRGRRWRIETLLTTVATAMAAGARSLAEAERVTATLPRAARRWLGIDRRVPDTTLRDALGRIRPPDLISSLHAIVLAAHRRKALQPSEGLPFGFVSLDGRALASQDATTFTRSGRPRTSTVPWWASCAPLRRRLRAAQRAPASM